MANIFSIKATQNEAQWIYLRDKLIYTPQTKTFKKAAISGLVTMPLWVLPWAMLRGPGVTTLFTFLLFGTSYLWLRYWRTKEGKSEFMKFIFNWDENKHQTPQECHEKFERLSILLKNDPAKFEQQYLTELESLRIQISSHVNTSRII